MIKVKVALLLFFFFDEATGFSDGCAGVFALPASFLTSLVALLHVDAPLGHQVVPAFAAPDASALPCIMQYFVPLVRCGIIQATSSRFSHLGNICILWICVPASHLRKLVESLCSSQRSCCKFPPPPGCDHLSGCCLCVGPLLPLCSSIARKCDESQRPVWSDNVHIDWVSFFPKTIKSNLQFSHTSYFLAAFFLHFITWFNGWGAEWVLDKCSVSALGSHGCKEPFEPLVYLSNHTGGRTAIVLASESSRQQRPESLV